MIDKRKNHDIVTSNYFGRVKMIRSLRGVRELFGEDAKLFRHVEDAARKIFEKYSFEDIKIPVIERTELFARGIGDDTDIVTKEMYTFPDRKGRSITLRPEGTAGVVRHYIEQGMDKSDPVKRYYYSGPMFRYERPQKGRYRQFFQIGVEAFGEASPLLDADVITMLMEFFSALGIDDAAVTINNIGCGNCRPRYNEALKDYLKSHEEELCHDCRNRIETNPLRVLDCKKNSCSGVIEAAPVIQDYLCDECRIFHRELKDYLDARGGNFREDNRLVRGLDYYTRTVFEIYSQELGAQNALMGGGRYDCLVKELGGKDTPGFGFALGVDRIIEMLRARSAEVPDIPGVFAVWNSRSPKLLKKVESIRACGWKVAMLYDERSFKSQLRYADKKGYRYVVFLGDEELDSEELHVKDMKSGEEVYVRIDNLGDILK